jgi:hypothetical protein
LRGLVLRSGDELDALGFICDKRASDGVAGQFAVGKTETSPMVDELDKELPFPHIKCSQGGRTLLPHEEFVLCKEGGSKLVGGNGGTPWIMRRKGAHIYRLKFYQSRGERGPIIHGVEICWSDGAVELRGLRVPDNDGIVIQSYQWLVSDIFVGVTKFGHQARIGDVGFQIREGWQGDYYEFPLAGRTLRGLVLRSGDELDALGFICNKRPSDGLSGPFAVGKTAPAYFDTDKDGLYLNEEFALCNEGGMRLVGGEGGHLWVMHRPSMHIERLKFYHTSGGIFHGVEIGWSDGTVDLRGLRSGNSVSEMFSKEWLHHRSSIVVGVGSGHVKSVRCGFSDTPPGPQELEFPLEDQAFVGVIGRSGADLDAIGFIRRKRVISSELHSLVFRDQPSAPLAGATSSTYVKNELDVTATRTLDIGTQATHTISTQCPVPKAHTFTFSILNAGESQSEGQSTDGHHSVSFEESDGVSMTMEVPPRSVAKMSFTLQDARVALPFRARNTLTFVDGSKAMQLVDCQSEWLAPHKEIRCDIEVKDL